MRKDFDYVLMTDYQKDMDDMREMMMAVHRKYQTEIEKQKRLICALINSAGEIHVNHEIMFDDTLTINWHECPMEHKRIYKAGAA